jgi:hypothetical protein
LNSFAKKPVVMSTDGPWGQGWTVVLPGEQADYCRQKLGLPVSQDPNEFKLSKNCLCLHESPLFATDAEGLWFVTGGRLLQLDFELKTNRSLLLPAGRFPNVTALCRGGSRVWIGTETGLIEWDQDSDHWRQLTEKDGLLMDPIADLRFSDDTLWIGYDRGIGRLDLRSGRIQSFTTTPFRVGKIQPGADGVLWVSGGGPGVQGFELAAQKWKQVPWKTAGSIRGFASDDTRIVTSHYLSRSKIEITTRQPGGSWTNNIQKRSLFVTSEDYSQWYALLRTNPLQRITSSASGADIPPRVAMQVLTSRGQSPLPGAEGLPAVPETLLLNGSDLWAGGEGFIAVIDLANGKLRKLAYVPARTVDRIQLAGGYVWATYNGHLHRAPLSEIQ